MSNPYGTPTYTPMAQQQPGQQPGQDPYQMAFNNYGQGLQQSGPAKTFNLGTQASPQEFGARDQGFLSGLNQDFSDQSKWGISQNGSQGTFGTGYYGDMTENYGLYNGTFHGQNEGGPWSGHHDVNYSYNTIAPSQNLKTDFTNFGDAQDYYRKYFDMTKGFENVIPQMRSILGAGMNDAQREASGKDLGPGSADNWMNPNILAYQNVIKQRQEAALAQYLNVYNNFGQQGAFGSGFQNRTTPFRL